MAEEFDEFNEFLKKLTERSPALAASGAAFLAGIGLLLDDAHDFGKLDTPNHPSPLHHWIWGILLMLGGAAGLGASLLDLLSKTPPLSPRVLEERLPPSWVEEGLSPSELKKIEEKLGIT